MNADTLLRNVDTQGSGKDEEAVVPIANWRRIEAIVRGFFEVREDLRALIHGGAPVAMSNTQVSTRRLAAMLDLLLTEADETKKTEEEWE